VLSVTEYCIIVVYVTEYCIIVLSVTEYCLIVLSVTEYCIIVLSVTEYCLIVFSVTAYCISTSVDLKTTQMCLIKIIRDAFWHVCSSASVYSYRNFSVYSLDSVVAFFPREQVAYRFSARFPAVYCESAT
jgi:hypothetical protein